MRAGGLSILLGAVLLVLAACGSDNSRGISHGQDLANGRTIFINGTGDPTKPACGSCHTLAAAGTTGTAGPNLDDAFRGARGQGFKASTFEQVVREQIAIPGIGLGMPANLVTGSDAADVAFFVARCAANLKDPQCQPQGAGG